MALSPKQILDRKGKLTASRVGILMSGDNQKIYDLWRELTNDPDYVPEDLSNNWHIWRGEALEPLILRWYSLITKRAITRQGEVVLHPFYDWAAATLDGFVEDLDCPIECKVNFSAKDENELAIHYAAQIHWQMFCLKKDSAVFAVSQKAYDPVFRDINLDREYAENLFDRASNFWKSVISKTPPAEYAAIEAPTPISEMVELSFEGHNQWADFAADWIKTRPYYSFNEKLSKSLKELVPENCKKAYGHGLIITRNKARALTIKQEK